MGSGTLSRAGGIVALVLLLTAESALGWHGYVSKVRDGDSLVVKRGGKFHEIRLYGVDAPEHGQAFSDRARWYLIDMARKRTVSVEAVDRDRYDRIVALVSVSGKLINRELVRNGLAWVYPRYCTAEPLCGELADLERKARARRYGLWRDSEPMPPWEWKRIRRETGSAPGPVSREYRFLNDR